MLKNLGCSVENRSKSISEESNSIGEVQTLITVAVVSRWWGRALAYLHIYRKIYSSQLAADEELILYPSVFLVALEHSNHFFSERKEKSVKKCG